MKTFHRSMLCAAVLAASVALPAYADKDREDLAKKLVDSKTVYQELLNIPDHQVPDWLLKRAKAVVVVPHSIKGALGYGARVGYGVMSVRNEGGSWSPPCFVKLQGGSVGFQIGAESNDLVLFFMTESGARSLVESSKFTLGGKASVAAGPFGRSGEADTDAKLNAEIYTYSKTKGLFAGVSLEGARLAPDKQWNATYYGQAVTAKELLFDQKAPSVPAEAEDFRKVLPS